MNRHNRTIEALDHSWFFHLGGELPAEVAGHGNVNFIANETRVWQKAGNHAVSRPENPHIERWRKVDLPHDFVLEGEFSPEASLGNGSLPGGDAWYVRHFELPESDAGRRISIEFDGVYRNCSVFCNGHFVGRHLSGYTSFSVDLTEVCAFGGPNAVAVYMDARENELWSYDGGGIYRGVRLVRTAPVHIPQWGVFVRTGGADNPGAVMVSATVRNSGFETGICTLSASVLSPDGVIRAAAFSEPEELAAWDERRWDTRLGIDAPRLWSVEDPVLYSIRIDAHVDGRLVDTYVQPFGFRYCHFDAEKGFFLNGQPLKLKGTCCHQDSGCVGIAVPPALQAWRVKQLKSYGCNALRTSHNPPDPTLLDACDRLGMLVMDEIRVPGIADDMIDDVRGLILRDRNHPSVILWSLGNEEMKIQNTSVGIEIFRRLNHLAHELDPSRPTTYACNCDWINICDTHNGSGFRFDVWGCNYRSGQRSENYDDFHAKYPDWPMLGSETWGGASTRGLYQDDGCPLAERWLANEDGWADDRRFVSAYANWCTPWGYSIEETWRDCANRPFMAGTFVWTGFDYRGETSPYAYPAVITRYGVLDVCGFYKPVAHYLRAWWRPNEPHVHLMPHWNWQSHEGEPIQVRCYANSADVELFLNRQSLGRQRMPRNGRLEWAVPYAPGELKAVGYDPSGAAIAEAIVRTAGAPAQVRLDAERVEDILVVNAAVVDAGGVLCPEARDAIVFEMAGPARLLGVGNGNPISHEPDQCTNRRQAYHGRCQAVFKIEGAGAVTVRARSGKLAPGRTGGDSTP